MQGWSKTVSSSSKQIQRTSTEWAECPPGLAFQYRLELGSRQRILPWRKSSSPFTVGVPGWEGLKELRRTALFFVAAALVFEAELLTEPRLASSSQASCLRFWNGKITVRRHHIQLELSLGGCRGFLYRMGRWQIPKGRDGCLLSKGLQATI